MEPGDKKIVHRIQERFTAVRYFQDYEKIELYAEIHHTTVGALSMKLLPNENFVFEKLTCYDTGDMMAPHCLQWCAMR